MVDITTSEPFLIGLFLVLDVIFYIAVISIPFILVSIHRSIKRQLNDIEKELHKVNDFALREGR